MRILVVGSGGREHALSWKLAQEAEVICAPGNPGIAADVECVATPANDFAGLSRLAKDRGVDLVVVGPEDPLVAGLADELRSAGHAVFGPGRLGAQLEASKAFSKELMFEAKIPTAQFLSFHVPNDAKTYARERFADGKKIVVKASGNALGKGVVVCDTEQEAEEAIDRMMIDRIYGDAGAVVVIEDRLNGPEFSLLTLVSDQNFTSLPVAQDRKRAHDRDQGPNTGGMGTYSPVGWVTPKLVEQAEERVVAPILKALKDRGIAFRGMLFSGMMMEGGRPNCLEFNVRFGDPETQTLMMRLRQGLGQALYQASIGDPITAPEVNPNAALTVVVASGGYPDAYEKGVPITLGNLPMGTKLFHAGTAFRNGKLITAGGRVFGASASASRLDDARRLAYAAAASIKFEGAFFRSDIASEER